MRISEFDHVVVGAGSAGGVIGEKAVDLLRRSGGGQTVHRQF